MAVAQPDGGCQEHGADGVEVFGGQEGGDTEYGAGVSDGKGVGGVEVLPLCI